VLRYENDPFILAINRPLANLGQALGETGTAGAILERLLHHVEVVELKGRSYRV